MFSKTLNKKASSANFSASWKINAACFHYIVPKIFKNIEHFLTLPFNCLLDLKINYLLILQEFIPED